MFGRGTRNSATSQGTPHHQVLLVEDDPNLREALEEYVASMGFEVCSAADGDQAMELIIHEGLRPGLVLLDLRLPVMSGWELLSAFDRSQPLAQIPCVVITGVDDHGLGDRRQTTVLRKPFALSDLARELRRWAPGPT